MNGFRPESVRFVLMEPQYAGNAGAAARALKNLGYSRLALVSPAFAQDDPQAVRMAVDAADLLAAATLHATLDDALAGARVVIGTSGRRGKHRRPHYRLDEFAAELPGLAATGELAVVFGREDSGLTDHHLDRCTHLIEIPTALAYSSLNLSQAVLLLAWELRRAVPWPASDPQGEPSTHERREAMYRHLEGALWAIGFLHEDSVDQVMRRIRRLLSRAGLTPLEVRLVRGLARQMRWAARQAGLDGEQASKTGEEG